jgi:hypothetical protein
MRIIMRMTAIVGVAMLALAACGEDSDDSGGVASISGDPGDSEGDSATSEEEALEWARCMRDEGVDVPDPEVDEDGNVRMGRLQVGGGGGIDIDAFQAATEVCGEPPGREMSREDESEMQDAMLEMVQCLRDKGYDMPDPQFEEGGGVRMGGEDLNFDPEDPEFQEAQQECQEKAFAGTNLEDRPQ